MESLPHDIIAASKPFRILVGPNKTEFMMHTELLSRLSKPLHALATGDMKEAAEGVAEWPEVDEQTFVRFWKFAYTGDYDGAEPTHDPPSPPPEDAAPVGSTLSEEEASPSAPGLAEDDWGTFSARRRLDRLKKKKGIFDPEPEPVPVAQSPSKWDQLWNRFKALDYSREPRPPSPGPPSPQELQTTNYREVFLSHARVYVLADYYDIENLMRLSLAKLHVALQRQCPPGKQVRARQDDFVPLLNYSYANTVDKGGRADRLRDLLAFYAACRVEDLWTNVDFADLLEQSGEISKAIIGKLLDRLS